MGTDRIRKRRGPHDRRLNTPPVRVADSLSFLINKLAQLAGRGMTQSLAPLGVQPRESGILAAINQFGPTSQQRIGELLLIDRTTMVLSIDRLEQLELVERAAHPSDRRSFLLRLTPKGVEATQAAKRALEAFEGELLAPLTEAEAKRFRATLLRVVGSALEPEARATSPRRRA